MKRALTAMVWMVACGGSGSGASVGSEGGSQDGSVGSEAGASSDGGGDGSGSSGEMDAAGLDAGSADTSTDASTESGGGDAAPGCTGSTASTLLWSDEFNAADGTGIDTTKWAAVTGGTGWGNQELEYYTNDLANAQQTGGNLVITATTEGAAALTCWYGACHYTSARLQTMGLFSQQYGRFEARIKLPAGQGLWPASWMLGNNFPTAGWPTCGEIDLMENIGSQPGTIYGKLHGPGYSGANALAAPYMLPGGAPYSDDFHVFAIEWETGVVRFYVDGNLYETQTSTDVPAGDTWVFDQPFYLLLNVAVGGTLPGNPGATTVFPQTMMVDYVRVCSINP